MAKSSLNLKFDLFTSNGVKQYFDCSLNCKSFKLVEGEHEVVEDIEGFKYPIKIVVSVKGNRITVITNYPLKKRRKK